MTSSSDYKLAHASLSEEYVSPELAPGKHFSAHVCDLFNSYVRSNKWEKADSKLFDALDELKPFLTGPSNDTSLSAEIDQTVRNVIRVGFYFDRFGDKRFNWLFQYLRAAFETLGSETDPDIRLLHRGLDYLQFVFGQRPLNFQSFQVMVQRVVEVIGNAGVSTDCGLDEKASREQLGGVADRAAFWSRLYYLRYQIALWRQDGRAAVSYLDFADHFLVLQSAAELRRDSDNAEGVLYLKTSNIGLARVFLKIFSGSYRDALELEKSIRPHLGKHDPRALLRAEIAEFVCRRALNADRDSELEALIAKLQTAIDESKTPFANNRLRLRLVHEQAIAVLLRIGLQKSKSEKGLLTDYLESRIVFMNVLMSKAVKRERSTDPVWATQISLLEARLAFHREKFQKAREHAENAVREIDKSPLALLQIQARITLAVAHMRLGELDKAKSLLLEAAARNNIGTSDLIADHAELTQPELAAVTYLYLSRVHNKMGERVEGLKYLEQYKAIAERVENAWILRRLASEVEREIVAGVVKILSGSDEFDPDINARLSRKNSIENASRRLQSSRTAAIAESIGVSKQTIYSWLDDLREAGLAPDLYGSGTGATEAEKLEFLRSEIDAAQKILRTTSKTKIAAYLGISRQTLYSRLQLLQNAGLPSLPTKSELVKSRN